MKEGIVCSQCGAELTEDERREFDGLVMCQECFDNNTTVCECCHDRIWSDEAQGDSYVTLCNHCYEYEYTTCEACYRLVSRDEACYDEDDYPYCNTCYSKLQNNPIKSYNYKPEPIFYGSGDLFMGVELEIDNGGEYSENAEKLLDIANACNETLYIKHDGSINDGFEIVSHPMTLNYHTNEMSWNDVFDSAVRMGYRSHQTQTCGLHIHINRSAFGKTHDEQEAVVARIVHFVELHWNELLKFSRRTEANVNRWASRYGILTTAQDTYKNAKDKRMGRYVAVNLENYNTIEFRLFRGTLRYKSFIAVLELVYEICRFAIMMSDKEIEGLSWSDFVVKISPDKTELIEYLKSKRLYVNELVAESEEK